MGRDIISLPFIIFIERDDFLLYPVQYVFVTGIDVGIRYPITLFNSYHRFYNITEPYGIISYLQYLQTSIRNSKSNREKRRLKRDYKEKKRAIVDILSQYILKTLPPYSILAMEDINYNQGWPTLLQLKTLESNLQKGCKYMGIQLVKVDPTNTSNMCPRCGTINKNNRDKIRHVYLCDKCGLICNDDAIAAWNIHNRAYEMIFGRKFDNTLEGYIPVVVRGNKNIPFINIIPD